MSALPAWVLTCQGCQDKLALELTMDDAHQRLIPVDSSDWMQVLPTLQEVMQRARDEHGWKTSDVAHGFAFCPPCAAEIKAGPAR